MHRKSISLDVKLHVLRRLEAVNIKSSASNISRFSTTKRCMLLSQLLIMEKAKSIFSNIQEESEDKSEIFTANRGWFDRFKKPANLYNIPIDGDAASSDVKAAQEFPELLKAESKNSKIAAPNLPKLNFSCLI
ncbi:Tigger transposable element-derived protein 1 [Trichinella papuae]|uniref:Tigger transposable element-derived protein 1 n=1 Tax=Trichinella papuae TaxID=268474 RepID=A0A0V1MFP8_9BILA|nr:Tigger transposable element-derived protein 1 [Trichinella papuae]